MRSQSAMSLRQWRWHSRTYKENHELLKYLPPVFQHVLCMLGRRVNAVRLAYVIWKSSGESQNVGDLVLHAG